MRLINTTTYGLETFLNRIPPYAILSHTWDEEEVLFSQVTTDLKNAKTLKGWQKIESCCREAAKHGWEYAWIDTCCIDKRDTVELSEAINSMFRWYEDAEVCYAYLQDVPPRYYASTKNLAYPDEDLSDAHLLPGETSCPWNWHFRSSRWFTRGWTLQEMLAPTDLIFLDRDWGLIGSKEELAAEIQATTGIAVRELLDFKACCLGTKLSWAVDRQTTREEDLAYSLLGLLGVNMPLIYGEGKRSFLRLQQELIKSYNDESVLAWGYKPPSEAGSLFRGLANENGLGALASSVNQFTGSNDLIIWPCDKYRQGYTISNAGLHMNAELFETIIQYQNGSKGSLFAIKLNCAWAWPRQDRAKSAIVLFLKRSDIWEEVTMVFHRGGPQLRTWDEVSSLVWRSHGRQDIVIVAESFNMASQRRENCYRASIVAAKGVNLRFLTLHHRREDGQLIHGEDDRNRFTSATLLIRSGEYIVVHMAVHSIVGGNFDLLLKWTQRTLWFGLWNRSSKHETQRLAEMQALGESDQISPFPHSVVYSGNHMIQISGIPEPNEPSADMSEVTSENLKCMRLKISVGLNPTEVGFPPHVNFSDVKHYRDPPYRVTPAERNHFGPEFDFENDPGSGYFASYPASEDNN